MNYNESIRGDEMNTININGVGTFIGIIFVGMGVYSIHPLALAAWGCVILLANSERGF